MAAGNKQICNRLYGRTKLVCKNARNRMHFRLRVFQLVKKLAYGVFFDDFAPFA
jgi:hypothetical protein